MALFWSATFAALVTYTNGHTASAIEEAAMGGVSSPMGAIFIFFAAAAVICAIVGVVTGSSWTTAGTLGWRSWAWLPS